MTRELEPNRTQVYKLEDNTRDTTKTLIVQYAEKGSASRKAVDYIVTRTVEEKVHIADVVKKINEFPELHARTHNTVRLEVTSGEQE